MKYVFNNIVTGAFTGRKAECPKCDVKAVGRDPSVLARWRHQAQMNAELFLESQFGKKLKDFNKKDTMHVSNMCKQFMSPERAMLLTNLQSFRNRVFLAAREHAPGVFLPLSPEEAERIWNDTRKNGVLSPKQKQRLMEDIQLMEVLPMEFVRKHLGAAERVVKLTAFDRVLALPQYATPKAIDDALEALAERDGEVELDAKGRVVLTDALWKRLRAAKEYDDFPEAMKQRYNDPGMLQPKVRGRKPLPKPVVAPVTIKPMERVVTTTPEREARRAVTPVRAPKPEPVEVVPPRRGRDMVEDLSDWDGTKRPVNRVPEPSRMMSVNETVRFVNRKANEALLPGDFPRGEMSPITTWSNTDWLLVNKYKQYIDPTWLASNQAQIDRATRRFNHITGETTASLRGDAIWDALAGLVNVLDRAGM